MTQTTSNRPHRRGRLFPEFRRSPEDLARLKSEKDARCQRYREVFTLG